MILSHPRREVGMDKKVFWNCAFLLLGLINIFVEIRRERSEKTDQNEAIYCDRSGAEQDSIIRHERNGKDKTAKRSRR